VADQKVSRKADSIDLAVYGGAWKRLDFQGAKKYVSRRRCAVIGASEEHVQILRKALEADEREVVSFVVEPGAQSANDFSESYVASCLDSDTEEALRRFFDAARSRMGGLDCVLDCRAWASDGVPCHAQATALLLLARVLGHYHQDTLSLVIIGDRAFDILGEESLLPGTSALAVCSRVISREYPHMQTRFVDVASGDLESGLLSLGGVGFLTDPGRQVLPSIAGCRGRTWWGNEFKQVALDSAAEGFRRNGVYIITGGLGSLGRGLALHLLEKYAARVYVLSRRSQPQEQLLAEIEDGAFSSSERVFFERAQKLSALGGRLICEQCDVSSQDSMVRFLTRLKSEGEHIDAVLHLAGFAKDESFSSIVGTNRELIKRHMLSKGCGAEVLRAIAPEFSIPQVVVFSSLASSIGGTTLYAYAAANSYANAVARQASQEGNSQWISVEWDVWANETESRIPNSLTDYAISYDEGFRILSTLMGHPSVYHVCVTKRPLLEELSALEAAAVEESRPCAPEEDSRSARADVTGSIEETVQSVMSELLGISDMTLDDNFFERGGDSLLAVQAAKMLSSRIGFRVLPAIVFDAPSPNLLGAFISQQVARAGKN
jgi:NAD(P)-dependent dehydrogenase (short-subunit alcohol dehydrogenase family)